MTPAELNAIPFARAVFGEGTATEQDGEIEAIEVTLVIPLEAWTEATTDPTAAADLIAWLESRRSE